MSNRLGGLIAGQNINASIGTFTAVTSPTFTFASSQATPAVGQAIQLTTTGTLPTGLSTNTTYYVISVSTNTCQLSTTLGGSAVTFTNSSGSGTHTAVTQRIFNPYAGVTEAVEYLVVAGGGGGGNQGPGGGAGGLLTATGYTVVPGTALTVTVGAGGAGTTVNGNSGSGTNSVFSDITAIGGGGVNGGATGLSGGSGGGKGDSGSVAAGGAGTRGQGHAGGACSSGFTGFGGGGGGAGSPGVSATQTRGGDGGTGLCSTITGQRVFYAGGGAGGGYSSGGGTYGGEVVEVEIIH